jgi:hypothetical protein
MNSKMKKMRPWITLGTNAAVLGAFWIFLYPSWLFWLSAATTVVLLGVVVGGGIYRSRKPVRTQERTDG